MKSIPFSALALSMVFTGCAYPTLDEAVCPPEGTELSYENFGAAFFARRCNSCHSAPSTDRRGAPEGYVFATYEDVIHYRERIYARSAGSNDSMPPGPDDPPLEERDQLAEWLACGAP